MKPVLYLLGLALLPACQNPNEEQVAAKQQQAVGCAAPAMDDHDWYTSGKKAPRLQGLEGLDFRVTTSSAEAQDYINQGLMLAYGFNHAEAARSFYQATRLDSTCAMAWWGYAYVLGPNYNGGMEDDNYQRAWEAANRAKALAAGITPKEAALVDALQLRYAATPPADRSPLDRAYANAMQQVYRRFPGDPDVGTLYAEAIMDQHPWDLYDKQTRQAKPWTPEIVAILEHVLRLHPRHPGAHHFYIHAMETSATPEKALGSARLLEQLVPGSGHLVHMPSHIYINTGDYHLGSLTNINAVAVDSAYTTACHAQGVYPLAYYPHNDHFLAATATLEGNAPLAWQSATRLQRYVHPTIMREPGWGTLQHYYTIPWFVGVKLALWDTLLLVPRPADDLIYPRAIWHYARGMALLGKNRPAEAQQQLDSLQLLDADSSLQALTIWDINTCADLVSIATHLLAGSLAARQQQTDKAVDHLSKAIAMEDALNYNEPPDWFFSVRHHLGAVLLQAGRYAEAEKVYRDDLRTWKKNGWALMGLFRALEAQKNPEAAAVKAAFDQAWAYATVSPDPLAAKPE